MFFKFSEKILRKKAAINILLPLYKY